MTKLIFLGCLSNSKYKHTSANAIRIVQTIDSNYKVLENTPCCGALSYHVGNDSELKEHVEFVNNWFKENNVSEIVTICAGCYNYLNKHYNQFLGNDFKITVKHFLQFLAKPENLSKLNLDYSGSDYSNL